MAKIKVQLRKQRVEEVKGVHKELPLLITAQWHQASHIRLQHKSPFHIS